MPQQELALIRRGWMRATSAVAIARALAAILIVACVPGERAFARQPQTVSPSPPPLAASASPISMPSPNATSAAIATPSPSAPQNIPAFNGPDPLPTLPPATPIPVRTIAPGAVRPSDGGAAWEAGAIANLRHDLDAIVRRPALAGAHVGVFVVDARNGSVLFEHGGDDLLQPASTFKLLVGSAAIEKLGPAFRFRTAAYLSAAGTLVLRGGGDPFLSTNDIDDFAASIARASDSRAMLDFAVNASHFDRAPYAPGWTWDDFNANYSPKISALTLEENVLHLFVTPGDSAGSPAVVYAHPLPVSDIEPANLCTPTFETIVAGSPATLAAGSEETLDTEFDPHGCVDLVGGIPANSKGSSIDVAVPSPEAYAYRVAVDRLHAHGVDVRAYASRYPAPYDYTTRADPHSRFDTRAIWTHDSLELAAIMPRFWVPSDNLVGENLLKELGVASSGEPGSREKGIAFEKHWLQSIGIDPSGFTFADGCGLSQYDRISPHGLVAILQHDWNGAHRDLVLDSLPVGGARGHIEGVAGTIASGRVWAKTGSFSHVRGLAGYVATIHHGTVTFAFNVDDFNGDYGALAETRAAFLARIARE